MPAFILPVLCSFTPSSFLPPFLSYFFLLYLPPFFFPFPLDFFSFSPFLLLSLFPLPVLPNVHAHLTRRHCYWAPVAVRYYISNILTKRNPYQKFVNTYAKTLSFKRYVMLQALKTATTINKNTTCTFTVNNTNTCTLTVNNNNTCILTVNSNSTCTLTVSNNNTFILTVNNNNTCTLTVKNNNTCILTVNNYNTCILAVSNLHRNSNEKCVH